MRADTQVERAEGYNWVVPGLKVRCIYDFYNLDRDFEDLFRGWGPEHYPVLGETYTIESVQFHDRWRIYGITLAELAVDPSSPPDRVRFAVTHRSKGVDCFEPVED